MYRFEDQTENEVASMKTCNTNCSSKHHYSHSQDEERQVQGTKSSTIAKLWKVKLSAIQMSHCLPLLLNFCFLLCPNEKFYLYFNYFISKSFGNNFIKTDTKYYIYIYSLHKDFYRPSTMKLTQWSF